MPQVAELVARKEAAIASKLAPATGGIAWSEMRDRLAQTSEISHWIMKIWGPRETGRYLGNSSSLAEFLLLREFNRRPRRGNTAETMGLARLRFDAIDRATKIPEPLQARGFGEAAWQELLYSIIDMTVRARFAFRANPDDLHWINTPAPLAKLLSPREKSEAKTDLTWPVVGGAKGNPSNLLMILEKALHLDRGEGQDRAGLNQVLEEAWDQLLPLFSSAGQPGYALDFNMARIAPIIEAWRCPVTRRVLSATALGLTQYGHRDGLTTANLAPQPLSFPRLPVTFPRGSAVDLIHDWLATDPQVADLREHGVWANPA